MRLLLFKIVCLVAGLGFGSLLLLLVGYWLLGCGFNGLFAGITVLLLGCCFVGFSCCLLLS